MNGGMVMRGLTAAGFVGLVTALAGVAPTEGADYQSVKTIAMQFGPPYGVTVDSSGNVWAAEDVAGVPPVQEFSSSGTLLNQFGYREIYGPTGIAFDTWGNAWVSAANGLLEYSGGGTLLRSVVRSGNYLIDPTGVAVDSSGNILVSDDAVGGVGIEKFSSSGTYLGRIGTFGTGSGQLFGPEGLALDSAGDIWVADDSGRIVEFDRSGNFLQQFGSYGSGNGQLDGPHGITIDSSGNVWVADTLNNRIEEFSSAGAFLTQFGSYGNGIGQLYNPFGVAVDPSGNFWVADTGNYRLQEFSPVPEPSTVALLGIGAFTLLFYGSRRQVGAVNR